jgi:hypothetical protein
MYKDYGVRRMANSLQYIYLMDYFSIFTKEKQQMITGVENGFMTFDKAVLSFSSKAELTNESSSNEILEKLQTVKYHTDLVIYFAAWYARETGKPFSQMLKVGLLTLIKSAKTRYIYNHVEFSNHLKNEITSAMLEFSRKSI